MRETQTMALKLLGEAPETLEEIAASIKANNGGEIYIPACPLMHGTGLFTAMAAMMNGGTIVTLGAASLDTDELWRTVERRGVTNMAIVGDAFAKPMLAALEAEPGKYDLSSLTTMISSGVMWSMEVKQAMLEHLPQTILMDKIGRASCRERV